MPWSKIHTIFLFFLQIVEDILWCCSQSLTLIFNKGTTVYCILDYSFLIGRYEFLIETLLQLLKRLSSPVQGFMKRNNLLWTEFVQTILHSEFHSDQVYSRLLKSSGHNIALKCRKFLSKHLHFKDHTVCISTHGHPATIKFSLVPRPRPAFHCL